MVALDQGNRAGIRRPSLRNPGTIPVQCIWHVALEAREGIWAGRAESGEVSENETKSPVRLIVVVCG